jgi:hypothetical protein
LSGVIASFAWITVATTFFVRPLADLNPESLSGLARLMEAGARAVAFVVALVLLLQERDHR